MGQQAQRDTKQNFGLGVYAAAYALVLVLLAIAYATSRFELGDRTFAIGLVIALLQVLIVAFAFMHLKLAKGMIPYLAVAVVVFVALLFSVPLVDLTTRFPPARPFENTQGPSPTLYPVDAPR